MRESTLILIVLIKWLELIFITLLVAGLYAGAVQLIMKLGSDAVYLTCLTAGAVVIATFHLIYNTLIWNLRFACKTKCYSCGKCCFDIVNYMICACCLKRICDDKKDWLFIVKWVLKLGYMITLIVLIKKYKAEQPEVEEINEEMEDRITFENILIVYCAQYLIFVVMRPILFTCWSILTCCCPKGKEYDPSETFEWSIISNEYQESRNSFYNGFRDY